MYKATTALKCINLTLLLMICQADHLNVFADTKHDWCGNIRI